jgi:hypothetical protein
VGEEGIRFVSEFRRLPPPLDNRFGLLVAGTNRPDDLFMYIWRPVTGLVAGQRYRVRIDIEFATNVAEDCAGVGGEPGKAVLIKAGASDAEPAKRIEAGRVVTDIDNGDQATSGVEMVVIGDFTGGGGTCTAGIYRLKTLSTAAPQPIDVLPPPADALLVTADAGGRLWIVIGTESGFEARTEIYYLEGRAIFTPV